ncbi:MAG: riboflavin kinase, partial [Ruminococcus sp.]
MLVELLHAREVFCGGDFRFGAKAAWNIDSLREFGRQMGFAVHQIDPVFCGGEKISSTAIRDAIRRGEPETAAGMLGTAYRISGSVVHGAALGRTRAVPTINIPFA